MLWGTVAVLAVVIVAGVFFFFHAHHAVSDADIVQNIKAAFFTNESLRKCAVDVTAQKGVVTLVGLVNTDSDKANAVNIVKQLQGVKQVTDQLVVRSAGVLSTPAQPTVPPTTPVGQTANVGVPGTPTPADAGANQTRPTLSGRPGYGPTWLGFENDTSPQDRETELHQNCSADFRRVYVPPENGNGFTDLCHSAGQTCQRVCDWEGNSFSCSAVSQGGRRDGSRIALCQDQGKASEPTDSLGTAWNENELGWNGTWARRGASNIFDANWGGEVTAVLAISMQGNGVKVERRNSSDGNDCDYQGTVAPDGVTVSGTYSCKKGGPYTWRATIQKR